MLTFTRWTILITLLFCLGLVVGKAWKGDLSGLLWALGFAIITAIVLLATFIEGLWRTVGRAGANGARAMAPHVQAGANWVGDMAQAGAQRAGVMVANNARQHPLLWLGLPLLIGSVCALAHGILISDLLWFAAGVAGSLLGAALLIVQFDLEYETGAFLRQYGAWILLAISMLTFWWAWERLQLPGMHWSAFYTALASGISAILAIITIAGRWGRVGAWFWKWFIFFLTLPIGSGGKIPAAISWTVILFLVYLGKLTGSDKKDEWSLVMTVPIAIAALVLAWLWMSKTKLVDKLAAKM